MITEPTRRKDCYTLMRAGYQMADACELCQSTQSLVIDHIIPLAQGGSNDLSNLRTLCQSCNAKEAWKYRERPELDKYTTHLRPGTIKAIKRYAFEHDSKLGEIRTHFEVKLTKSARIVEINHPEPGETAPHLASSIDTL